MKSIRKVTGKKLFISVNFDVFMLNFTVQFEFIAEIMKIENKYVTAMFAAFQKKYYDIPKKMRNDIWRLRSDEPYSFKVFRRVEQSTFRPGIY